MRTIVVGVAEETTSLVAAQWAADVAVRRQCEVQLVHAVDPLARGDVLLGPYAAAVLQDREDVGRDLLETARAAVRRAHPGLSVRTSLDHDHARRALLRAMSAADLVVTGARHRGPLRAWAFPGLVLGSTSLFLAARSTCPVAVVATPEPPQGVGVVVGDDGSPAATAAVEFAADEAAARGDRLVLVQSWLFPVPYAFAGRRGVLEESARAETEQRRSALEERAAALRQRYGIPVEPCFVPDVLAADVLVRLSERARLLVVGRRGRGAVGTALLGSTCHEVLHRAPVPVVVVPAPSPVREPAPARDLGRVATKVPVRPGVAPAG